MKNNHILIQCCFILVIIHLSINSYSQGAEPTLPHYKVTLPEAHIGNLDIDTKLLDSYELLPENIRQFYLDVRFIFSENKVADFTNIEILKAARKHKIALMGGPMLGNLRNDGTTLWLRPSTADPLVIKVMKLNGSNKKTYVKNLVEPGVEQRILVDGLSPDVDYKYTVYAKTRKIAEGKFRTAPSPEKEGVFKLAFGSCFHKIGLHNPNLINQILKRKPFAMILLGDIAVDDRENRMNMHRSDYLLRDVSKPWQLLSANLPIYSSWDDHDYLNDDLSGIPSRFTEATPKELCKVWHQNWNNPDSKSEMIYFSTRIGPVELIMLDTRSCRKIEERGKYGSYLGIEQQNWLIKTLKNSTAPYKIISSGTMWSDYITNGKDSWGTWDTLAREEIFNLIETENISGVLLISGDRHGARGFTIPRPSGNVFYEFEAASLGGVPGPPAMSKDTTNQLFGYHGKDIIAFGEFTFDTMKKKPLVTFRLIDELGNILEEHALPYSRLTP